MTSIFSQYSTTRTSKYRSDLIRPLNSWQNLEIGVFEVDNLVSKMLLFRLYYGFPRCWGYRRNFIGFTESQDARILDGDFFRYMAFPSPWDSLNSKNRNFLFFKRHKLSINEVPYACMDNSNLRPNGIILTFIRCSTSYTWQRGSGARGYWSIFYFQIAEVFQNISPG